MQWRLSYIVFYIAEKYFWRFAARFLPNIKILILPCIYSVTT